MPSFARFQRPRASRLVTLVVAGSLGLLACEAGVSPGAPCTRSSECTSPLVCRHGRCRTECREARDCPVGLRCLIDASGLGACGLPPEESCASDAECGSDLACSASECRTRCSQAVECGAVGSCAADGTCVVPHAGDDAAAPPMDAAADDTGATEDSAVPRDAFVVLDDGGRPISGTGASCLGGSCPTTYECATAIDPTSMPVCRRTCVLDGDCAGEGGSSYCQASSCTVSCDAFANSGCGTDVCGLYPANAVEGDVSFTDCRARGRGAAGGICAAEVDCGPSLVCFHGLCRTLCHPDQPAPGGCAASEVCNPLRPVIGSMLMRFPYGACCPSSGC